ncbi:MAG TPA: biotin/lipoyl-binding protein, partial [Vampirovibrionales bacterium]
MQPHPSSPGDRSHSIYGGIASAIHPSGTALNPEPSVCEKPSQRRSHWSPSVQALLDQPTAAFPRQLLGGGLAFCLTFLVWAWFGEINEVGQARGELIPQGNVYPVHPVDLGRVAKIAVTEGSPVKAGQIIAELDPTLPAAELTRIDSQLSALELQVAQKQSAIETAREEAKTRTRIAEAETKAHETAIAQGENNLQTIEAMLSQQEEDAIALKARLQGLIPLVSQSEQLVAQLQADIQAQEQRQERLVPVEEQTEQLIAQLQTDVIAQGERREFLEPLEQKSQELIAQLTVDIQAQEERLERLKPLVEEGALSKENLFQSEQALRDRRNALIRAQMAEASQAKERLFEAEQALRDRQNVLTRAQISDVTQAQERLFEAAQTLRDRTSAALRSQLSEAAQVRERVFEAEQALRTQNQRITETEGKFMQA